MPATAPDNLIAPEQITRATKATEIYERGEPCWRCEGTGYVRGFSHVHGGICFRCGGVGTPLTKRGQAARQFYLSLARTPVEVIREGERVFSSGVPGIVGGAWVTIDEITTAAERAERGGSCALLPVDDAEKIAAALEAGGVLGSRTKSGDREMVRVYGGGIRLAGTDKSGTHRDVDQRDGTVLAKLDPAVAVAIRKTVAEYQQTLTKAGKPRKGTRWADAKVEA